LRGQRGHRDNILTHLYRVTVFFGLTGTGKSFRARELSSIDGATYYKPHGKWWQRYEGQENVIIDDFYGWIPYDEMLRIMDQYPHQVETKGGYKPFLAKNIYITSNLSPENWYHEKWFNHHKMDAFMRRIDIMYEFLFDRINKIK